MQLPDSLDSIAAAISDWATRKPLIWRVWLFGSRVRGDNRSDSDLDIAIELDKNEFVGSDDSGGAAIWMFETEGWKDELQQLSPCEVQVEQYIDSIAPTVASGINQSGALIYEKELN